VGVINPRVAIDDTEVRVANPAHILSLQPWGFFNKLALLFIKEKFSELSR